MEESALDETTRSLISSAKNALRDAYAPYSNFRVGAAIILDDGTVLTGSNQENAAYPLCMCAERVAVYAKAALYPDNEIRKIAIVAMQHGSGELTPATPCGACRQVLLEFETRQKKPIEVVMLEGRNLWLELSSAAELLPYSFTRSNLNV